MNKAFFVLSIAFLGFVSASIENKACLYSVNDTSIFNFFNFTNEEPHTIPLEGSPGLELTFHLCTRKVPVCGAKATVFNYGKLTKDNDPTFCENLTPSDMTSPVASFYNESDADAGIRLTFPTYSDGTTNTTFIVNLLCNENITSDHIKWTGMCNVDISSTTCTIIGSGKEGCPATLAKFLQFFNSYYYLFAIAFIIIGILSLIGGIKFFNVTIFVLATVLVASVCAVFIFELTTVETSIVTRWVIFIICLCIGLGAGYAAIKIEKVAFFALGALLGALGALFLYSTVLHFLHLSDTLLYVIVGFIAIIGGGLGLWLWKDIIILSTSCIGAYLIVRGASFFIGGFPNELQVAEGTAVYDYAAYAYLAVMVIIAVGGIIYQWKHGKKKEELEGEYHKESLIREEY